jgi:amidase
MAEEPGPEDCWAPGSVSLAATGRGPLEGLTAAVKDMIAAEGHVSSFGHPRWRETHQPAAETAPALARLLAAGASVAGLAKLDQLAYSVVGNSGEGTAPLNPQYPDRFTCGSSSGPASAVAAGLTDIGIGTDTGGSVRVPSAACGLFGIRPTHGLVSAAGVLPLAPSFDVVGVMTRSASLISRVLDVLAAGSGQAPAPAAIRRVLVPTDSLAGASQETAAAVRAAARAVAGAAGWELADCRLGGCLGDEVTDLFARVQGREVWRSHSSWLAGNSQFLAPDVRARVERAERLSAPDDPARQDDERGWRGYPPGLDQMLSADSVAVLPVMADLPPLRSASQEELLGFRVSTFRYTVPSSLSGRPEVVIPVHHRASGKRLGVGIIGPAYSEAALLRAASLACPGDEPLTV